MNPLQTSASFTTFETLEGRQMFCATTPVPLALDAGPSSAAPASLVAPGNLLVSGTDGNDKVSVRKSDGKVIVDVNGRIERFDARGVKRITVNLGAGDDIFATHGSISIRMAVNGDAGDDNIRGGLGDDFLNGDDGADVINGGYGNDTLSGGKGSDILVSDPPPILDVGFAGDRFKPGNNFILADGDGASDVIRFVGSDTIHADGIDRLEPMTSPGVELRPSMAALFNPGNHLTIKLT